MEDRVACANSPIPSPRIYTFAGFDGVVNGAPPQADSSLPPLHAYVSSPTPFAGENARFVYETAEITFRTLLQPTGARPLGHVRFFFARRFLFAGRSFRSRRINLLTPQLPFRLLM